MPPRDLRVLLAGAAATAVLLLVAAATGSTAVLPYALPLLVLLLPLLAGRYVGEQRIAQALARRRRPKERRRPVVALAPRRRSTTLVPRGGRLIARSLAVRPPPVLEA